MERSLAPDEQRDLLGERRRRRVPLTIGVVLLVGVVGFAGLAGWRHMSRASLYHHAPGFYVLWCMDDAETAPAIGEVWPGQWVFQGLPLNAPAHRQRVSYFDATTVPTVVPARAEVLSLDEVEHEPSAEGLEPR